MRAHPNTEAQSDLKSSIKWIGVGVAIFGVGYLAATVFRRFYGKGHHHEGKANHHIDRELKTSRESVMEESLNSRKTEYSQYYFDKDLQLQIIESEMPENPSAEEIYLNSPLIAQDEYIKYTREVRRRRRLVRKTNEDQYISIVLTYHAEVKQLLARSRQELMESLNLDYENLADMEEHYENFGDISELHHKAEAILKGKLISDVSHKKMSDEMLKSIVQQKLGFMHNRMYDRLKDKLYNQIKCSGQQKLAVIQALLDDIVYEKFGYEPEDITIKIENTGFEMRQMELAIRKMEGDVNDYNVDSLESEDGPQEVEDRMEELKVEESLRTVQKSSDEDSEDA